MARNPEADFGSEYTTMWLLMIPWHCLTVGEMLHFVISILPRHKQKRKKKKSKGVDLSWGDAPGGLETEVNVSKTSPKNQTCIQVWNPEPAPTQPLALHRPSICRKKRGLLDTQRQHTDCFQGVYIKKEDGLRTSVPFMWMTSVCFTRFFTFF